jgi:signal peptidase I
VTLASDEQSGAPERRLHPALALLAGVVGLGYLYVGRIGLAFAYIAALFAVLLIAGWTRWLVEPTGWYVVMVAGVAFAVAPVLHPVLIAWRRPAVPRKRYNRWWVYLGWVVGFGVLLDTASLENRGAAFGYDNFRLPSGSMTPTLEAGDWIVVDTWRYRDVPPAFGDIVVYRADDGLTLVKRLVGVPGDTIEMRGRLLVRNGSLVDEPYLREPEPGLPAFDMRPLKLGPDEFFMLGDHRENSRDSRQMGPVRGAAIVGRAEFIALSFSGGVRWDRFPTRLAAD